MAAFRQVLIGLISGTPAESWLRRVYTRLFRPAAARHDTLTGRIMRRVLHPSSNCIDAGAYRGSVLAEMLQLAPQGEIFAFEPHPENYAYLRNRYPRAHLSNLALSDTRGTIDYFIPAGYPAQSGLHPSNLLPADTPFRRIQVATAPLDEIIPPDLKIDFIKIDVEGAEYALLCGARRLLERDRPYVLFEHGASATDPGRSNRVFDLLADCRLALWRLPAWLAGEPPFTRPDFRRCLTDGLDYMFLAAPRPAPPPGSVQPAEEDG